MLRADYSCSPSLIISTFHGAALVRAVNLQRIIQALSCCTKGRRFPWPDRFRFRSSLMYTCVWNGSNPIFSNAVISASQWQATHSMGQAHLIQTYSQILPLMLSDRALSLNEILPLKQVFGVCILKYVNSITFKHHQYLSHALNISMSQKRISVREKNRDKQKEENLKSTLPRA